MDIPLYRKYLQELVQEAIKNSDGSKAGITTYLVEKSNPGRFSQHRVEKNLALEDARKAFNEHRHWPLEIIISHLGVEVDR